MNEELRKRIWNNFLSTASVKDTTKLKSPKAAQALRENKTSQPKVKYTGNTGKKNSTVKTYTNKTVGTEVQVKDTPNAKRGRSRDVAFRDTNAKGYNQPTNKGTAADRKLKSAVVQDQIARAVPPQKSGDRLTADPTSAGRGRLYGQQGTQFASGTDRAGNPTIDTKTLRSGNTVNARGQKAGPINLERLKIPLLRMGTQRVLSAAGPYGRAASTIMQIDQLIESVSGKSGTKRWHEAIQQAQQLRLPKPTSGLMGF